MKLRDIENEQDPKNLWKLIKSMDDTFKTNDVPPVTNKDWLNHFQSLHQSIPQNTITKTLETDLSHLEKQKHLHNHMDFAINNDELKKGILKLKNKKAAGLDKIRNEMIKSSYPIFSQIYLKLFNLIMNSSYFPSTWCFGLITPIYKSGGKTDPGNYRGICVSSCLGKLFCSILNSRLLEFCKSNNILHPSQIGFQPGFRTSDHIFSLKTLIENNVQNTKSGKLYACFVDFKKAFDSIWHKGLLYRLLKYNIGGKFYDMIKNLYDKTKCAIKLNDQRTDYFTYSRGVRQGCILSPLLFNLYINELAINFDANSLDCITLPNDFKLNCLFYADDLIILSKTEKGLQDRINILSNFCNKWQLEVNIKKTKVMVFQKATKHTFSPKLYLNSNEIEFVKEYTYLGVKLFSSGSFLLAQQTLRDKAMNALYAIRKYSNIFKLSAKYAKKIFDSNIVPILTYASEIWGCYTKDDLDKWDKTPTEKAHLHFCKIYLGVNKRATNAASRSELGRLPLKYEIEKRILNYYTHLENLSDSTIAKQMYNLSKTFPSSKPSFLNHLNLLVAKYNLPAEPNKLSTYIKKSMNTIKQRMLNDYIPKWITKINNSSKLQFYNSIKHNYLQETYIDNVKNIKNRYILSKFRLSNHSLQIEKGRYCNPPLPADQRTCPLCKNSEIENELHFLFHCNTYSKRRELFYNEISDIISNFKEKTELDKVTELFDNNNTQIQNILAKYISECFQLREERIKQVELLTTKQI